MLGLAISLCASLLATDLPADNAADPLIPYRNQPVLSVDVQAPPGNDPQELRDLIDIQPGFLLEQRDVQEAIKRLYALGRFSQVTASAERQSGVVLLHFVALPLRRLDDITLSGLVHVDRNSLRSALDLNTGDEVDTRTSGRIQTRALAYLHRVGYVQATVQVARSDEADLGLVAFNVRIDEGPPRRVTELNVRGRTRLAKPLLLDMLHLRPGAVLNLDDLNQDAVNLRQAYIDHGFLRVQIPKPYIRVVGDQVTVTFTVDAGDRTALVFSGNSVFSDQDLRALYPDASGAVSPTNLRVFRQRVLRHYRRAGYANVSVALRSFIDRQAGTRRDLLQIDEGQPLQVTQVTFPGIHAIPQELLIEQLSILLRRELADDPIFSRLRKIDQAEGGNPWRRPPPPPPVALAPDERWVPDFYQEANEQITAALHDLGYLSAELGAPQRIPLGGHRGDALCAPPPRGSTARPARQVCPITVEVPVHEGEQTFIHSVGFSGNVSYAADTLLEVVSEATSGRELSAPVLPGSPLSSNRVEDGRIEIIRHYRNQGYLYVRAFAKIDLLPNKPWGNVSYSVEEGPQVRVQRLLVRGNRFTREGVIRSRIALAPGDLYRLEQAVADQRSIASLGVFSSVRVKLIDEEHAAEQKDAVAEVVERNRHSVEVAPGISTTNGPRLRLQYSHLNLLGTASQGTLSLKVNRQVFFDLFGQYADELRARYASYRGAEQVTKALEREVRIGVRSPPIRLLPFDPLVRLDLVNQRVNNVLYSLDSAAAILGVDMIIGHGFKGSLEGQIGLTNLECVSDAADDCNENAELRRQQNRPIDVGRLWTLKGGPLLIWDKRDSPINPTRGVFISGRYTYAIGAAGKPGAVNWEPLAFSKYEGSITGYVPLWRLVLALQARAGTIGVVRSQVPIDEAFFMGGRDTLRGFVESTLIPQDDHTSHSVDGQPPLSRGGNTFMVLKTELRVPVADNVYLSGFIDVGNLWVVLTRQNFVMRIGTGVGVRYNTPVGALAIDLGFNPAPRAAVSEAAYQLHFSIGAF